PQADLDVSLSAAPKPAAQKKPVTITIIVRNHGPESAQTTLSDVLPAGSQFVSLTTSQGTCTSPPVGSTGAINCTLGGQANGGIATVKVTITPTIKKGTLSDTATVTPVSPAIDPVPSNNSATVAIQVK